MKLNEIIKAFQLDGLAYSLTPFGNGLINHTWKVSSDIGMPSFILQRVNTDVFTQPENIANNIQILSTYFQKTAPDYLFVTPLSTSQGASMVYIEQEGYFRMFPFVENSKSFDVVSFPDMAYEAAHQFGLFTYLLSGFDPKSLKNTLPDFHNLDLRFLQFMNALQNGNADRIHQSKDLIHFLQQQYELVDIYRSICTHPDFHLRVTHHDTKISNVLFNKDQKGLCVIDLDTVMPGYFISDVGDMMRTYLSPVSEEEKDLNSVDVRDDYFIAIVEGYLSQMKDELSAIEKQHFIYAGKFMIYMQALRFLTDHIRNDIYYGASYEGHNLVRAQNQATLLLKLMNRENDLLTKLQQPSYFLM